ncbi:MAG: hypothetical protein KC931_04885 [Candidatus Omnitrophica bacterium]|nr:hypothetical protein [Candidatus Omnitrophota bacterium]
MTLKPYIQKVAVGPRGSKDLTREEAREANNLILSGEVHPVEFGALTMAMRVKGEADSELIGAVDAFHDHCDPADWDIENLVTVASPFDGKDRLMVWTPAAALLAAASGAKVLVLSDRDVPPKKGVTPSLVFQALGYPPTSTFAEAADLLCDRGWACVEMSRAIPALGPLKEWRELLGKRPYLSTAEKLINPARSPYITGVFHGPVFRQMDRVVRELSYPKTLVVQGSQGSIEPKNSAPTNVCLIERDREMETFKLDPGEFNLRIEEEVPLPGGPNECAALTRRVFAGEDEDGMKATMLTAGMLLWISGIREDMNQGVQLAASRWQGVSGSL